VYALTERVGGRAQVKCTDKCKCEDCKNRCDDTPRERAEAALCALMHQAKKNENKKMLSRSLSLNTNIPPTLLF
jgi:hypothetical protein